MALRYNVPHPVDHLRREMDRLLSGVAGALGGSPWSTASRGELPVNAWETDEALMVELELPGVRSEQLELSVVGNELTIKVDRPEPDDAQVTYHRRERPVGACSRALRLPVVVDADKVQAELRDGVLTLTLPKAAEARPRKIQVVSGQ